MKAPNRIEVSDDAQWVTFAWGDRADIVEAAELREACICADCRSDAGAARKAAVLTGQTPVTIEGAELRGAYAVNFAFGPDHHATGIFTWDLLRAMGDEPTTDP